MWNDTFGELISEYIIPAEMYTIDAWTISDLVHLSNLIDIELQKRYAESDYANNS